MSGGWRLISPGRKPSQRSAPLRDNAMKTTGQKRAWNRAYYYRHRERLLLDMKERHQRCHHIWEARYKKNKEVIAQKARAYRLANIEKFREYDRLRHIRNRDARSAYNKKRRSANVAQRRARDRELYRANAEAICAKKRASGKTPEGRIKIMMRNTVKRITLKGGAAVAKSIYYLGCSIEHARAHIERQFELGMNMGESRCFDMAHRPHPPARVF